VGAGEGPFVYVAVGARGGERPLRYPVDETALRHGAGVREETTEPRRAYEGHTIERGPYRDGDLP
jgi:hypothetical protein